VTQYRRNYVPGGSYFFTVNLLDRSGRLLIDHIDALREAFRLVKKEHPFRIDAMVVLPEHLHAIWTLPLGDADYSTRWKKIKAGFSKTFPKTERRSASRLARGERGIWQRRAWEHTLRDENDYVRHFDYIHYNPVKHGHVRRARDWPWSTFHRCVRQSWLPVDWGGDVTDTGGEFGEP
jgi:putative transposase